MAQGSVVDELANRILALSDQVQASMTAQHLKSATIHDGQLTATESVPLLDGDGEPIRDDDGLSIVESRDTLTVGVQADGTSTVVHLVGAVPWTPTPPTVVETTGGLSVVWDGLYMDDEDTDVDESREPWLDFARVEVHAGPDGTPQVPDHALVGSTTRLGTIETPTGGAVALALEPGRYWIALAAFNRAGEPGEPSFSSWGTALAAATPEQLEVVQASADGKNTITHSENAATGSGRTVGDTWFQHDSVSGSVIAQWSWTGEEWRPALLASQVIASLDAGKITTGQLAAGTRISAGPLNGDHAELNGSGLTVYRTPPADAEDTTPYEAITVGHAGAADSVQLLDADGNVLAGFDAAGTITGQQLQVAGVDSDGDGQADSGFVVYGRDFSDHLVPFSRGMVGSAFYSTAWTSPTMTAASSEVGIGEIGFTQLPGRAYSVHWGGLVGTLASGVGSIVTRLRYTTDGSAPTISSPILDLALDDATRSGSLYSTSAVDAYGVFVPGQTRDIRIAVTLDVTGTINWTSSVRSDAYFKPLRFWARDEGLDIPDVWQGTYAGGNYSTGTAPPPPAAIKKTYTSTWGASSGQCYNGSGGKISKAGQMQQGFYSGTNGNTKSIVFFGAANSTGSETGKTITQALAGATVKKVEVRLRAARWYASSGGTGVVGMWSVAGSSPPASFSGGSMGGVQVPGWAIGQERWVTLSLANAASALSSGSRGVLVGPGPSNSTLYYGAFYGPGQSNPPAIRITYTK